MSDYVVYVHQNRINGKRYIGITNNTLKRWCGEGKRYKNCPRFWSAIQKYGWDNFTHDLLETGLSLDEANRLEQYYIKKYGTCDKSNGYNMQPGGNFVPTMTGKHHSDETKKKIGDSNRGKKHSKEQNRQHSEAMKGKLVGSKNHKSKYVRCINTGEIFESLNIAAKEKNVSQAKITLCCQGKRTHTHGFRWEYVI